MYVIDTSSWLKVDTRQDSEEVWTLIVTIIQQGRIVACAPVLTELRDDPMYLVRIKPYEKALQAGDREDVDYLLHVGKITHDHPGMCRATGSKTHADPYVVALAELENHIVLADETCTKRPNRKIPGVCQQRKIRCLTLDEFIKAIKSEY